MGIVLCCALPCVALVLKVHEPQQWALFSAAHCRVALLLKAHDNHKNRHCSPLRTVVSDTTTKSTWCNYIMRIVLEYSVSPVVCIAMQNYFRPLAAYKLHPRIVLRTGD